MRGIENSLSQWLGNVWTVVSDASLWIERIAFSIVVKLHLKLGFYIPRKLFPLEDSNKLVVCPSLSIRREVRVKVLEYQLRFLSDFR